MEEIWTPWRMRYILGSRDVGPCIFCQKPKEVSPESLILHRGPTTFVLLNLYPYTVGHLMVIPYRHLPRFQALTRAERDEMALRLVQTESILRRVAGARWFHVGINLGRPAGAGVDGHLHTHVVPRGSPLAWSGPLSHGVDLPVPIERTYEALRPHFDTLP